MTPFLILVATALATQYTVVFAMLMDNQFDTRTHFKRLCIPFYWLYNFIRYKIADLIEAYQDLI